MTPLELLNAAALFFAATNIDHTQRSHSYIHPEEITLVDGSTRAESSMETVFTKYLWNEDAHLAHEKKVNLSYCNNPNVVTLDKNAAIGKGEHIQADGTHCKISKKNISSIYIERMHTCDISNKSGYRTNIIEAHLKNLLPTINSEDGRVLLEWHPFTIESIYYDLQKKDALTPLPKKNIEPDFLILTYIVPHYFLQFKKNSLSKNIHLLSLRRLVSCSQLLKQF